MICFTSSGANHTSPSTIQHLPHPVQSKFKPSSYHGATVDLILRRKEGFPLFAAASALVWQAIISATKT